MARRRQPEPVADVTDVPVWVERFRYFDPVEVDRWAGPNPGPTPEFRERYQGQGGTKGTLEEEWHLARQLVARRLWRSAAKAWWREHLDHPRAPGWAKR